MIVLSETHRGTLVYEIGSDDRLQSCGSLNNFRNNANRKMSFRQALIKFSSILRNNIEKLEMNRLQALAVATFPNLGIDIEIVHSITKETGHSPKIDVLHKCNSDSSTLRCDIINRFQSCEGRPIYRLSDVDKTCFGPRARGSCIVCKARTNWYCVSCRNWACHQKSESTVKHIVHANEDKNGHRITEVKSCFMHCNPIYL